MNSAQAVADQLTPADVAALPERIDDASTCEDVRERFLIDPIRADLSGVRPTVARSWRRSIAWNAGLEPAPASQDLDVDQRVIDSAEPAIRMLLRATRDQKGCVVVADRFATVATLRGSRPAIEWAGRCFGPRGTSLAEDVAGTNTIGTAIEERRGLTVAGAEHLSPRLQACWSSSALVHDPLRRSVRAVIALALPVDAVDGLNLDGLGALVDRAAAEVIDVLAAKLAAREQALLTAYLRQLRKRGSGAVMAIDGRTTIANHGALELLGANEQLVLAAYAQEAQRAGRGIRRELSLEDGSTMDVHVDPVVWAGEPIGSVLDLRACGCEPMPAQPRTSSPRVDPFAGLIGESPVFARAMELAHRAIERAIPVHIVGEQGTGKRTLALAMARSSSDDILCVDDPSALRDEGLTQVTGVLDGGGSVVITRAELLEPNLWSELLALAQRHSYARLVLTARRLPDAAMDFVHTIGSMEIEMPALRARRDDVRSLVSAFLDEAGQGPRCVSSRLLKRLTDTDLPGNVAQLRDIVASAARRCSGAELTPDDLTETDQQTLMRATLSPLQAAEATQIRAALREAKGNRVRAAEILRIGRSTLYRRLDMYSRLGFDL